MSMHTTIKQIMTWRKQRVVNAKVHCNVDVVSMSRLKETLAFVNAHRHSHT